MLTGTPVLSVDYGAFSETIPDYFRCHTQADWIAAIDLADQLYGGKKSACRDLQKRTQAIYGLDPIGKRYDAIFQQVPALRKYGWALPKEKK
jgi:hypothetical protein